MADNLKEYLVTLHRHEDLDDFYEDMETPGGNLFIPDRRIDVANRREISRNTHYYLTPEEAEQVKNDPRVWDVEAAENIPDPEPAVWSEDTTHFDKRPNSSVDRNWALKRVIDGYNEENWFSDVSRNGSGYYFAGSEGQNVDVVIFDGIIDDSHPEYAVNKDGTGGSRAKLIDWNLYYNRGSAYPYDATRTRGQTGSTAASHGLHVAGTAAGNLQGWARKSDIYNLDPYFTTTSGGKAYAFDALRAWNKAKPVNPVTGLRNRTVTNHSYGTFKTYVNMIDINYIEYRGTTYRYADFKDWTREQWEAVGFWKYNSTQVYGIGYGQFTSDFADQESAMNEGIIYVAAGGNGRHIWATNAAHPDWNNKVNIFGLTGSETLNYCRGVNHSYRGIIVGNVDAAAGIDRTKERAADSSAMGEGITVWAPGTNILAPLYPSNGYIPDPRDTSYRYGSWGGTSMASPQVAGVAACILSKFPTLTHDQVKQYIIDNATLDQIEDPDGRIFASPKTPNRYLYYPPELNEDVVIEAIIEADKTTVNEQEDTVTFVVQTAYAYPGTKLKYEIVSSIGTVSATDFKNITSLAGELTLDSNRQATFDLTIAEDFTTENTEKFFVKLLDENNVLLSTSPEITIQDTSLTESYTLSADKTSVDEGDTITFTVNTVSVRSGTVLVWVVKNYADYTDDLDKVVDSFTITGTTAAGSGSFSITPKDDFTTEGNESFIVEVRKNSLTGPIVAQSNSITINDTSVDPTYAISNPDKAYITEGETVTFTVTTTGVPVGTVLYWTTTGAINPEDFDDNSLTGTVTITGSRANGTGTITRTLVNDRLTEGFESFYLNLKIGSITGGTVGTSGGVVVEDTSLAPTYTLSADKIVTNESSNIEITLTTTSIDNNTLVPYVIYGPSIDPTDFIDRIQLTGNFNVIDNTSKVILTINPDVKTEGPEAAYLKLTGPGRSEAIGFTIEDTSTEPPDDKVLFYIFSDTSAIREGNYLRFTIAAENVTQNITVPYELLGIQPEDLLDPTQIRGNIILYYDPDLIISPLDSGAGPSPSNLPAAFIGGASAQLQVGILQNFKKDGIRTVLLNLTPDYNYEIKIVSSIQIIDDIEDTTPRYTFAADKYTIIEGQSATIRVDTFNVPTNTIVTADIITYANSKITAADFVGLSNLSIVFPPTEYLETTFAPEGGGDSVSYAGNAALYTLQTADDFVFEQTEYFYLQVRGTFDTSGLFAILDSGNSIVESRQVYTGNVSINFLDKAVLEPDLGGYTIGKSYWENTAGMLSEKIFIQGKTPNAGSDSAPFYQPFSYVIRSNKSIELWRESIKNMIHPAGLALFSEITNETQPEEILNAASNATVDSEITEFFALTADTRREPFYVSSNLYSNSRFEIPLKSDFAYYIHRYF